MSSDYSPGNLLSYEQRKAAARREGDRREVIRRKNDRATTELIAECRRKGLLDGEAPRPV